MIYSILETKGISNLYIQNDNRQPLDLDLCRSLLNSNDSDKGIVMCEEADAAFRKTLTAFISSIGFTRKDFCAEIGWDEYQACRALRQNSTKAISYEVIVRLSELFRTTISYLFLKQNIPIVLPEKYVTTLKALKKYSSAEGNQIAEMMRTFMPKDQSECDDEFYREMIYKRIMEYAVSHSVTESYIVVNPMFRHRLQDTFSTMYDVKSFRSKFTFLLAVSIDIECAVDYFLKPDYFDYPGDFISQKGKKLSLRSCDKAILGQLAKCDNADLEAKVIADILIGKRPEEFHA